MRTTVYLTLSLLLTGSLASAQSRFGISVTAAPTYSHANITQTLYLPPASGSTVLEPIDLSNKSQAWGYVLGGMIHYRFAPNWSVSTGLWYNQLRTADFSISSPIPILTPTRTNSHGLQIPLFVNYRLTNNRLSPYLSVGGLASFRQSIRVQYEPSSGQGDIYGVTGKSEVTYRPVLGAGIAYRINPHLSLIAQPLLIRNFKPKGDFSKHVSYQINGQTQLVYSF